MAKAIFIDWCPKDALDGMVQLDVWEELAYRRVLDFIYVTGNNLKDDDRKLGWMTKTGKRWPRIKQALLADHKIYIQGGLVRNKKCDVKLAQLDQKIAQKRMAGKSSAAQRKSLGNNTQEPTAVVTGAPTAAPTANPTEGTTDGQRTQEPKNPSKEKTPSGAKKKPDVDDIGGQDDALAIPPSLDRLKDDFEAWWEHVPIKIAKGGAKGAEGAYKAARRKADAETLLEGIKAYAESVKGKDRQYIAHPKTWLNQERWLDEPGGNSGADPSGEYTDDQGVRRSSFTNSPMPEGAA